MFVIFFNLLVFPHHVAQHRPTESETTPPYAPRSSRLGSEPPSVEDDVDVRRYAILELHARNDDDDAQAILAARGVMLSACPSVRLFVRSFVLLPTL